MRISDWSSDVCSSDLSYGERQPQQVRFRHRHWEQMQTGPGIVMEVLGLDALAQRREVTKTRTIADVMHAAIKRFTPDLIVLDESHRIKGASSNANRERKSTRLNSSN